MFLSCAAWWAVGTASAGCHSPGATQPPHQAPRASWIDGPVHGEVPGDLDRLRPEAAASVSEAIGQLDRLIDLFDAARFGSDAQARQTLWGGLGGHRSGVGPEASHEAQRRLLRRILDLESEGPGAAPDPGALVSARRPSLSESRLPRSENEVSESESRGLSDSQTQWIADAIQLLTADLATPTTADELSSKMLAYRSIAESGHPRLRDNARWRLYDHVRGTLVAATEAPAARRMNVAVQALYVDVDSVREWMVPAPGPEPDLPGPCRPVPTPPARTGASEQAASGCGKTPTLEPPPTAEHLVGRLRDLRAALAADERWAPIVRGRESVDTQLVETVLARLPAPRLRHWELVGVEPGIAGPDTGLPIVFLTGANLIVDHGRPGSRTIVPDAGPQPLSTLLDDTITRDGRSMVLMVAPAYLPAPALAIALEGVTRSGVAQLAVAVRETGTESLRTLPLTVARSDDPSGLAVGTARVHVVLRGDGPRIVLDGKPLRALEPTPAAFGAALDEVRRAYPREHVLRLTIEPGVAWPQLVDVVAATVGGPSPRFSAIAWVPEVDAPPLQRPFADATLRARLLAAPPRPRIELEQPYPLKPFDQAAVESLAERVLSCWPELERPFAGSARFELGFSERRLQRAQLHEPRVSAIRADSWRRCVQDEGLGLRLRSHKETFSLQIHLEPKP